ncbi:hypothetical protein, partial [Enterococcus faecium]
FPCFVAADRAYTKTVNPETGPTLHLASQSYLSHIAFAQRLGYTLQAMFSRAYKPLKGQAPGAVLDFQPDSPRIFTRIMC